MYLASVVWHFLAMLPASVRLLTKDVKDRAFKWLSFMHHEFTQIITTLLSEMEMMRNKENLKLSSQPSSKLLSRVSSSPLSYILGRSHKFWLTFGHYRSFQEPKKSNPIKCQNFNLSFISQFLSSLTQVFLQTFLCHQMALFKIWGTHTAFPDACKTFFSLSFARSLIPTPANSLRSLHPKRASLSCEVCWDNLCHLAQHSPVHKKTNTPFPTTFSDYRRNCPSGLSLPLWTSPGFLMPSHFSWKESASSSHAAQTLEPLAKYYSH